MDDMKFTTAGEYVEDMHHEFKAMHAPEEKWSLFAVGAFYKTIINLKTNEIRYISI